jgi:ankyrin repeat protein
MATFVGVLRMRSKYEVFCVHGRYVGIGFGHLSSAAAVLEVESVRNVELTPRPDTPPIKTADTAQLCTPPDPAILCAKADSLLRAASIGCIDRVREFLAKTGIDSKNGSESLALRVAVKTGDDPMVKVLLNAGAPVNPVDPTRSPLAEAASARQIGAMKLLLAAGAKVDSVDHDGATLLGQGTVDPRVAEVLLEAGAQVDAADANGETALMKASASGFEKIMKVLIEHHADLNLKDKQGRTALMHAAASPYSLAVALLLENGADPNARDNRGKTALDLAEESNNMEAFVELSLVTKRSGAR